MEKYYYIAEQLKSESSISRLKAAEEIRDIYEFEYQYKMPSKKLVTLFMTTLLNAIDIEKNHEVKCELFDALSAWCYFPSGKVDYEILTDNLDKLEKEGFTILTLRVLIATHDKSFRPIYLKYIESSDSKIVEVAKEGLKSINPETYS